MTNETTLFPTTEETTVKSETTEAASGLPEATEGGAAVAEAPAAESKPKKSGGKKNGGGKAATKPAADGQTFKAVHQTPADRKTFNLDIRAIVSNIAQSRTSALPEVEEQGVGVFVLLDKQKDKKTGEPKDGERTLMSLLLSRTPEDREKGLALVKPALANLTVGGVEVKSDLKKLCESVERHGVLQNVGVNRVGGKGSEAFDLEWGAQRCIAKAIIFAQSEGKVLPLVPAVDTTDWPSEIGDKEKFFRSHDENNVRKAETPIDQAKHFNRLKKQGMNLTQIAAATGEEYQTVRNRLALLQLPQETQDKIHEGKLSWTKAVKDAATESGGTGGAGATGGKTGGKTGTPKAKTGDNNEGRRRMPTVKQAEELYLLTDRPEDNTNPVTKEKFTDEEWELWGDMGWRKGVAFYCGFEKAQSRNEIRREKAKAEKEALDKAAAEAAAAAAEAESGKAAK